MEALADVGVLASWSPLHKQVEVIDYYPDGRPHHVRATVKILGLVDKEVLEYHWGPDWVCWDADQTFQQHGQHIEYTVKPEVSIGPGALRHHRRAGGTDPRLHRQAGK